MQKTFLFLFLTMTIFSSCANPQQYGVDVLALHNFDFTLNIETFFQDESIFGGHHRDFYVLVSESYIDKEEEHLAYIQYSTGRMASNRPLASYGNFKFESLCILTDEADENVLMAVGNTRYAKSADVFSIMKKLKAEYSGEPEHATSNKGINFIYQKGDRVANLFVGANIQRDDNEENDYATNVDISAELKEILAEREDIECLLFVTTMPVHKIMMVGSSACIYGDLMRYK